MDQFVEEVQEEWRKDQLIHFWKKYGNIIIAGILIVIGLTVVNALYNQHQTKKLNAQTKIFEQALTYIDTQQIQSAEKLFDDLIKDGTPGYKIFSTFKKIDLTSNLDEKIKLLQEIVKNTDVPKVYKDMANYYIMLLKFDNTRASDYLHELNDFLGPQNYFVNHFLELKALTYYKLNQFDKAKDVAQTILNNKDSTMLLRTRVTALISQITTMK